MTVMQEIMAKIYARLIYKGEKSIEEVGEGLREEVKKNIEKLERGETL